MQEDPTYILNRPNSGAGPKKYVSGMHAVNQLQPWKLLEEASIELDLPEARSWTPHPRLAPAL